MNHPVFQFTGDPLTPATVTYRGNTTPVWLQQRWTEGEFARYIVYNGCGHCCCAMAANLRGVAITPYEEYLLCRRLWGPPKELPEDQGQDHFMSVAGIVKVLNHLGIPARAFPVPEGAKAAAQKEIQKALLEGKQVIVMSDPFRDPGNIFSTGYHYILAVGYLPDGQILIANSSLKATDTGIQTVSLDRLTASLYEGSTANMAMTWGELRILGQGCGYITVG